MGGGKLLLMLVPGRDDRAFYKRFLRYVARKHGLLLDDLDAANHGDEKYMVLDKVYRQPRALSGVVVLRGTSVLRLSSRTGNGSTEIVLLPTERRVTHVAGLILEYQAGLDAPTIDAVVAADDAEEMSISDRLGSMYNSLMSVRGIRIGKELKQGKYFRLLTLERPRGLKLMLLVQGLETVEDLTKHAIEDYVLHLYRDSLTELRNSCKQLLNTLTRSSRQHKKLALLIALKHCFTRLEELFLRDLDDDKLDKLVKVSDGLQELVNLTVSSLEVNAAL